jgi:hypothetical protein
VIRVGVGTRNFQHWTTTPSLDALRNHVVWHHIRLRRHPVGVAAGGGIRYTYYTLRFLDTVTTLPLPAWTLPAHSPKATRTCFSSILFSVSHHFLWHPFALLSHITARVSCLAPQSFCNSTETGSLSLTHPGFEEGPFTTSSPPSLN